MKKPPNIGGSGGSEQSLELRRVLDIPRTLLNRLFRSIFVAVIIKSARKCAPVESYLDAKAEVLTPHLRNTRRHMHYMPIAGGIQESFYTCPFNAA